MSFPASMTTRTVKGRFVTYPDGIGAQGSVRIVLEDFMQGPTDDAFVAPFDQTIPFDSDGVVSVVLPSNNDPQWTPGTYRIVLTVGTKVHRQKFDVPYDETGPLDFADILNLPPVTPGQSYVLLASKGAPGGVASLDSNGVLDMSQIPAGLGGDVFWTDIQDKPAVFPHDEVTLAQVTGLTSALSSKADLVGGVLPTSQVPSISIVDFLGEVSSELEMLDLFGQQGDWCIRTDLGQVWVVTGTATTQLYSWTPMPLGPTPVQTVNGQTGTVVLGKSDIGLGNVDNTSDVSKPISTLQQTALDLKASTTDLSTGLAGKANTSHTHLTSQVTGLDTALADKASLTDLSTGLAGKANTTHNHAAGDVTSGTLATARGGTGLSAGFTASAFLRASSSTALEFRSPSQVLSDIGAAAASHSHPTSDVTGLDTALSGKFDKTGGTISSDLTVSGYSSLHGVTVANDLVVQGYTSLQGISVAGDLQVPNLHVLTGTYLDGQIYSPYLDARLPGLILPSDHGYCGWTFPPDMVQAGTVLPTAGLSYIVRVRVTSTSISAVNMHIVTAGVSLTNAFVTVHSDAGVYYTGAVSANQASLWNSGGYKTMTLTTPVTGLTPGTWVKVRFWVGSATTLPGFSRAINSNTVITNAGLSGSNLRYATADSGLTTVALAPTTIGTLTGGATAWWLSLTA